ncbi:MAG: hypothetical protein IT163_07645 [Bryobacterales bacterium]|nr:hypothetical protein [Bryobacterales bacterium]
MIVSRVKIFAAPMMIVHAFSVVLTAQSCVLGTNQSGSITTSGYYSAFPKYGTRVYWEGSWRAMTSSGIKYVYCDYGPDSSDCPLTGGGDFNFTGGQITAMETALANWTSAKTANGSNLNFTRVYFTTYGYEPFSIEIKRLSSSAFPANVSATAATTSMLAVDYNNDGVTDDYRGSDGIIEIKETVNTYMTQTLVHEIGHLMGLADCNSCNATTIMGPYENIPTAPSACDNARLSTMFP